MLNSKRNISMIVLVCVGLVPFLSAGTSQHKSGEQLPSAWELIRKSQMEQTESTELASAGRVLHFPKERSLGQLMIQDTGVERNIRTFFYWTEAGDTEWEYLAEARDDVIVPADKRLALVVNEYGWRNLSELSRLKPDDLYKLDIPGPYPDGPRPDDRIMPYIASLTGLKNLVLGNTNISAQGLKLIGNLNSLERLHIIGLANDGLAEIAQLSSLKGLYLKEHRLTDKGMVYLEQMESLEELDISGGRLGNLSLAYVAKLPSLRYLLLDGNGFTDAGMAYIKDSPSLRILHFGYLKQLTDATLVHLSQMPQLERLTLYWNENITDAGIIHLIKLKSLTMLDIKHAKITDEGLANLTNIQTLENLTLPNAGITNAGIKHIAQLHNLRYLWSSSSPLTDKSLHYISALENLEELTIGGKSFSDDGMKDIAKLKKLRRLNIFSANQLTNDGLAELEALEFLTNFYLGSKTNVSISGLKSLNSLKKLKVLTLHDIRQDGSIMDISGLTDLQDLTILLHRQRQGKSFVSDSFRNEDWACFDNLTKIKRLQITGVGIGDEGVKHLSGMVNIEFLNIICPGKERITDEALKYMAGMHKLNRLYIKDGHFTDKALDYLDGLPALSWLELTSDFAFSNNAIRDFQQKNPMVTRLQLMP